MRRGASYAERGARSGAPARARKVDFIVRDALLGETYEPYQVCMDMTAPKTRKREVESLRAVMGETGLGHGTVVTLRQRERIEADEGTIDVVPAWEWLLVSGE